MRNIRSGTGFRRRYAVGGRAGRAARGCRRVFAAAGLGAAWALGACAAPDTGRESRTLVVYNAGSLARPLRAALGGFAESERAAGRGTVEVRQENAGSLETARKLTELGRTPDIVAVADQEVFPLLLVPAHTGWYLRFARNRMVLAHTGRSRHAGEITSDNWTSILQRPGVAVGRADPQLDPAGYRALLVMQLAESYYRAPGLAARLQGTDERYIRPKEIDLVALLQAGEIDYCWTYESVAEAARLPYVTLPPAIDLSSVGDSAFYAAARVTVRGPQGATAVITGAPIVYALSVPREAPNAVLGVRFVAFLLSPEGRRLLRAERLDALDQPSLVGSGTPPAIVEAVARPGVESPR